MYKCIYILFILVSVFTSKLYSSDLDLAEYCDSISNVDIICFKGIQYNGDIELNGINLTMITSTLGLEVEGKIIVGANSTFSFLGIMGIYNNSNTSSQSNYNNFDLQDGAKLLLNYNTIIGELSNSFYEKMYFWGDINVISSSEAPALIMYDSYFGYTEEFDYRNNQNYIYEKKLYLLNSRARASFSSLTFNNSTIKLIGALYFDILESKNGTNGEIIIENSSDRDEIETWSNIKFAEIKSSVTMNIMDNALVTIGSLNSNINMNVEGDLVFKFEGIISNNKINLDINNSDIDVINTTSFAEINVNESNNASINFYNKSMYIDSINVQKNAILNIRSSSDIASDFNVNLESDSVLELEIFETNSREEFYKYIITPLKTLKMKQGSSLVLNKTAVIIDSLVINGSSVINVVLPSMYNRNISIIDLKNITIEDINDLKIFISTDLKNNSSAKTINISVMNGLPEDLPVENIIYSDFINGRIIANENSNIHDLNLEIQYKSLGEIIDEIQVNDWGYYGNILQYLSSYSSDTYGIDLKDDEDFLEYYLYLKSTSAEVRYAYDNLLPVNNEFIFSVFEDLTYLSYNKALFASNKLNGSYFNIELERLDMNFAQELVQYDTDINMSTTALYINVGHANWKNQIYKNKVVFEKHSKYDFGAQLSIFNNNFNEDQYSLDNNYIYSFMIHGSIGVSDNLLILLTGDFSWGELGLEKDVLFTTSSSTANLQDINGTVSSEIDTTRYSFAIGAQYSDDWNIFDYDVYALLGYASINTDDYSQSSTINNNFYWNIDAFSHSIINVDIDFNIITKEYLFNILKPYIRSSLRLSLVDELVTSGSLEVFDLLAEDQRDVTSNSIDIISGGHIDNYKFYNEAGINIKLKQLFIKGGIGYLYSKNVQSVNYNIGIEVLI